MVSSLRVTGGRKQTAYGLVALSVLLLWLGPAFITATATEPMRVASVRQPALASYDLLQSRWWSPTQRHFAGLPRIARSFSGTGEAFATIFFSEIGDKSFFLTMMLAVRRGRSFALLSSQSALWLMTAISAGLGVMLRKVPRLADGHVSLNLITACLMFIFAAQTLTERVDATTAAGGSHHAASTSKLAREPLASAKVGASAGGRAALVAVEAQCGGEGQPECVIDYDYSPTSLKSMLKPAALIFFSEWGDRSMLATVSLAATRSSSGTFLGGILGHLGAGVLAVASGGFLDKYISGRTLKTISGLLFAVFGVTTLLGVY